MRSPWPDLPALVQVLKATFMNSLLFALPTHNAMQLWTGVVHLQEFAVEVRTVESDDGFFRLGISPHLNKPEASGKTSKAISHHFRPPNRSVLLKYGSNVQFGNVWIQVPN
jgi:hypothetical protein